MIGAKAVAAAVSDGYTLMVSAPGALVVAPNLYKNPGYDPAYVKAQASLNDPDDVIKTVPTAWWTSAWESMELAGNPPPPEEEPVDLVDGTKQ